MNPDDPRLVFLPKEQVMPTKSGLYDIHINHYCCVYEDKIVLYQPIKKRQGTTLGAKALGNTDKRVTEIVHANHYSWATIELIPFLALPIDPGDY